MDADMAGYFNVKAGEGVLITGVEKDTPAAKAGLKSGDVVVEMAGKPVKESKDIHKALAELKKGDSVDITVLRHGKKQTLKAEPDFERRERIFRIFSGGDDIEFEHLELPELDIRMPKIIMEPPCPPAVPDVDEITDRVHEASGQGHVQCRRTSEKNQRKFLDLTKFLLLFAKGRGLASSLFFRPSRVRRSVASYLRLEKKRRGKEGSRAEGMGSG